VAKAAAGAVTGSGEEVAPRHLRLEDRRLPKYYLTTAIDYSNGDPHLGHALEKVGADAIARYRRMAGDEVHFLMGMDEHSQSVIQAAAKAGTTPLGWVDRMAKTFADYWQLLECSHDDWIRTTEPRHARTVTALLERIQAKHPDHLFVSVYEGLYCTGCEEFKAGAQIVDGHCIEHPTLTLVPTKERNHFFKLSAYGDQVRTLIEAGTFAVEPEIRRNEILRLIEGGLQDISISRVRLPWGIPFPGDPEQTVYVWFDALINYLSATGFPDPGFDRLWPADLHVIGKGITRFHCVIWPAMLLAAEVPLPREVWAHGYVQWAGTKMSKTAGTAVNLAEAIKRYGPGALRYFLLREIGFAGDGDFTWERFDARYAADLADTFGNFVSRTLSMVHRYRNGAVPADPKRFDTPLEHDSATATRDYRAAMDALDLQGGAAALIELATRANRYVEETAPWKLAKAGDDVALDSVLANLTRAVRRLAILAGPFLPGKAAEIWSLLGEEKPFASVRLTDLDTPPRAGAAVLKPSILFPKPQPVVS
jgi:methionyl-tRNA synthetase